MKAAIGFVGAGWMGTGMAMRLLAAGHPVSVHAHRNRSGVDRLCARGAAEASDLATLARGAEVIVLSVSDAEAVRAVLDGAGPGLRPGHLVIDTNTSDPRATRALAGSLSARCAYNSAPRRTTSASRPRSGRFSVATSSGS